MVSLRSDLAPVTVCVKTRTGREAYFEESDPHPSDGRGNSQTCRSQLLKRLDTPTDGGRFSLSHRMGEGRGEGECFLKSEVVFPRAPSVGQIFRGVDLFAR